MNDQDSGATSPNEHNLRDDIVAMQKTVGLVTKPLDIAAANAYNTALFDVLSLL